MDTLILEPLKYYEQKAKAEHNKNLKEYFDSLVITSGVNVEENRATVKKYKKELLNIENIRNRLTRYRVYFVLLIILAILGGISAICGVIMMINSNVVTGLIFSGAGIAALLVGILVNVKKMRPLIKHNEEVLESHIRMANKLLAEAEAQMAPLNALFDDEVTHRLIEKTMPEIKFDRRCTPTQFALLNDEYDYLDFTDTETSVTDTLSGTLFKNPFLFERIYHMTMGTFTYTGSLVISWRETYRDSKGNTRTRTRTQTLYASVTKPKPYYKVETHLGFGSLAAPDLSFSRENFHVEDLSESARRRKVRRGARKLKKKVEKAITKGGTFQEMLNTEFEVLFGATNRNHEVQFRVMYTPLAQRNTMALITTETGYGDDFDFIKQKKFNVIKSEHAQNWQMHVTAAHYRSYDIDDARHKFMSFNEEYFKSVFFDFAPLMAVPVYQEEPVESMKTPKACKSNYTAYEHEVMANSIGREVFKHPDSATDAILKTRVLLSSGNVDSVEVTAHSFKAVHHLEFVSTFGGDGRFHNVPVNWIEYVPIQYVSEMAVCALDYSERTFNLKCETDPMPQNSAYKHGLMAFLKGSGTQNSLNNVFKKYL